MAGLSTQQDGTVLMTLDEIEKSTYDWLEANEPGKLQAYITQWLKDQATVSFSQRFARLSPQDQADVMSKFNTV